MLPPGIAQDRKYDKQITGKDLSWKIKYLNLHFSIAGNSDFKRKGVDRKAIAALPEDIKKTRYWW